LLDKQSVRLIVYATAMPDGEGGAGSREDFRETGKEKATAA
jgi:hypothetical protein